MSNADSATVIVVVGEEPDATGSLALDVAQDQAQRRSVTVVDLIGDAPALRGIAITDDPHGVADCFEYGLSFAAVSHPTTIGPALSVIASGTGPVAYARVLSSARWDRLIDHVRDGGGLIIFAVLSDTPGLEALMMRADRAISARTQHAAAGPAENGARPRVDTLPFRTRPRPRAPAPAESTPSMSRPLATGLMAAAAVILVAAGWWLTARSGRLGPAAATAVAPPAQGDTVTSTAQLASSVAEPTGTPASGATLGTAVNPGDSSRAAAFAVRVGLYATYADALRALRLHTTQWQATTIAPLASAGAGTAPSRYVLITGAARTRGGLDSAVMRWSPAPEQDGATVVQTPFALRLMASVSRDSSRRAAAHLVSIGIPVYALTDDSGRESIYAGAFDTVDEAAPLAASLRAAGIATVVAYRTGSMTRP